MNKLKSQIKLIIQQIEKTSTLLEQNKDTEAYASMSELIQSLNLILPDIINNENNQIYIEQDKFIFILSKTLEAMEIKDNLLLADLLQYELTEVLIGIIE